MSTITPHYRSVQQLLQSQSFAIDEYQREYKWEKENIEELLSDLQAKFLATTSQATKPQPSAAMANISSVPSSSASATVRTI